MLLVYEEIRPVDALVAMYGNEYLRSLTMSVPIPRGLPPKAIRADSPPEEPPDVTLRFKGLTVLPNTLFTDSAYSL
jgi:hypothetical protein